jgi:hypothetical protein
VEPGQTRGSLAAGLGAKQRIGPDVGNVFDTEPSFTRGHAPGAAR